MKSIDVDKISEGVHYELIPVDVDNEQAWEVRILRGVYTEAVLRYGSIKFDGERDCLTFNFSVTKGDATSEEEELQVLAGDILMDILDRAATEGWMITGDNEVARDKSGTNSTEEFTNE